MANENQLKLRVSVSARAAIVAGKTAVGQQALCLSEGDLAALELPLREEIAIAFESGDPLGSLPGDPPIVEATLAAVMPVLQARANARKADADARRAAEARDAEAKLAETRESARVSNQRSKALRTWIEKHGDDDQKARMAEGFLPEDEILEAITEELIDLGGFEAYEPLYKGDACDCACAGAVRFDAAPPKLLDSHQFARLQAAREAAPEGATVEPIEHRAGCPACKCVPIARMAVRVSLPWEGWLLRRQFSLR